MLTPLLFLRARICEVLPGDMDPVTELRHREKRALEKKRAKERQLKDFDVIAYCCHYSA